MKKSSAEFIDKEEVTLRINKFNTVVNERLDNRITILKMDQIQANWEKNLEKRVKQLDKNLELMCIKLDKEEELKSVDNSIDLLENKINRCMTNENGKKIWTFMQRFPHYDDLKDLNNKFLPELSAIQC